MSQVQTFEYMKIQLNDIKPETNDFKGNRIGSGGYGEVYKAKLKTKSKNELAEKSNTVAILPIKSREDNQGNEGFIAELYVLTRCEHPNIVSLLGFCVEGTERILVYEHLCNGSLDDYLGKNEMSKVTWVQRMKMCIHIAKGLEYLHTVNFLT
ncbi:putative protein kinase RLK-Pelle-RLCK-VIIa-2 family [Helianthus annuus]|nr:putative protein kinase RLK-Pelle-RLCK-VIIa-2 family [Helianthus annuus]